MLQKEAAGQHGKAEKLRGAAQRAQEAEQQQQQQEALVQQLQALCVDASCAAQEQALLHVQRHAAAHSAGAQPTAGHVALDAPGIETLSMAHIHLHLMPSSGTR